MTNLQNSGFDLFTFFEKTPDLVCIASKEGYFKKVNPSVIEKLGYTEEELFAKPISSFIYNEDKDVTQKTRTAMLSGQALKNFENRYITKDGTLIWLEWTSIYFPEDEVVFAIAKDATKRKLKEKEAAENYKKAKGLASHFKSSIEKDRKYFAYELHEELAQLAAVVKLDVNWISKNVPGLPAVANDKIDHVVAVSELLIKKIQRISFSVSPNMLDYFGLKDTLEWLCHDFSVINEIPCSFESNYEEDSLTNEMKIDFFRICQEALSNVLAHAEAKSVTITVSETVDKIELCITDDGKGFGVTDKKHKSGFASMHGRAASINGQLHVESAIGKGTKICFTVAKHGVRAMS